MLFIDGANSGDALTRLAARVDRTWSARRGYLIVAGEGRGSLYREVSQLDHFAPGGAADAFYSLSRRATVRASGAIRSSYASELSVLTQSGLLLPPVRTLASTALADLTYLLARRTSLSAQAQRDTVSFDSPTLIDGSMARAGLVLRRELGRMDALSLTAQYQRSVAGTETSNAQNLLAAWNRALGAAGRLRLSGGGSRFQVFGSPEYRLTPVGGGSLEARWGRHAVEARLERAVDLAYGSGVVRINRLAGARYAVSMAGRLTLEVGATRSRGHDAAVATSELSSDELNGAVRFALGPQLTLSGIYSHLSSEQEVAPPTRSDRAMLQLSYARAWR